jgi:RNA polymerase sigma-70 factor (ECF subfamily)
VSGLDRDEVRRLYDQHGRALLAYACSIVKDYSTAEDILHQVFIRLLRGKITISGSARTYLHTAVRNAAFNHRRRESRETELKGESAWLEAPAGMAEVALTLQAALWQLPQEQREIIVLRIWSQMSFDEAAQVIGISINTAASRYRYGIAKLKERLKPMEEGYG